MEEIRFIAIGLMKTLKETKDGKACFHSIRHYCNTALNFKGSEDIANLIIGHEGKSAMNARYNHPTEEMILSYAVKCGSLVAENVLNRLSNI